MRLPVARARIPRTGAGAWLASRSDGHRLHAGIDLVGTVGTDVLCPEFGRVVLVAEASIPRGPVASDPPGWSGYGPRLCVVLGERSGIYHLLAHLGHVSSSVGTILEEGARVGTIGELEHPHAHWECRSRLRPPEGAAIVEIAGEPEAWLRSGAWIRWDGRCPPEPVDDGRTPRACRPGWAGPPPPPFPHPRAHPGPMEIYRPMMGGASSSSPRSTSRRGDQRAEGVSHGSR